MNITSLLLKVGGFTHLLCSRKPDPKPVNRIKKLPVSKLEKLQEFMDKRSRVRVWLVDSICWHIPACR